MQWENTTNEKVLQQARDEIWQSWRYDLRRQRRSPAGEGAVRPAQAARLPRPFRRRRGAAAGGAAAGAGELCQRPESGGGADQQGDDRDPAEVRRQAAGESGVGAMSRLYRRRSWKRRAGAGRGRALLRPVDARRGREAHRPPLPQGRDHGRDGEGAAGPEAARRAEAHRDRLALGAHGEEPEPGVCATWTCRSPPPSCSRPSRARRPTSSR